MSSHRRAEAGHARRSRWLLAACLLAAGASGIGCDNDLWVDPCLRCYGPPPPTPTLQNLILRFEAAYERKVPVEYERLLTSNFRFTFSNQSDPALVAAYGNGWGKDDEMAALRNLIEGFTNENGDFKGAADAIALSLAGALLLDDPGKPDSGAFYKVVIVPSVDLTVTIAGVEEQTYRISAPHDFYLIRGDIAELDASQDAGTDRWYIDRWNDKSLAPGGDPADSQSTTWGRLKHQYRR